MLSVPAVRESEFADHFPPEVDRAWAAGFFDGEGNTCAPKSPTGYLSMKVTVGQARDYESLHKFASIVEVGKIYGPYPGKKPGWSSSMTFHASGDDAFRVLAVMFPYLGKVKIDQAVTCALKVISTRRKLAERALSRREQHKRITRERTHCHRGHELNPENIYYMSEDPLRPNCRECQRARARKSYHRNKKLKQ